MLGTLLIDIQLDKNSLFFLKALSKLDTFGVRYRILILLGHQMTGQLIYGYGERIYFLRGREK